MEVKQDFWSGGEPTSNSWISESAYCWTPLQPNHLKSHWIVQLVIDMTLTNQLEQRKSWSKLQDEIHIQARELKRLISHLAFGFVPVKVCVIIFYRFKSFLPHKLSRKKHTKERL